MEETEIFKICLEYWNALASDLYRENPFPSSTPLLIGTSQSQQIPPRRQMYLSVLSKVSGLCLILLSLKSEFKEILNMNGCAWNNLLECKVSLRVVPAHGFETTLDKFLNTKSEG